MALSSTSGGQYILNALIDYAKISSTGQVLYSEDGIPLIQGVKLNIDTYASAFANAYHTYALDGTVPGADTTDGDSSILSQMIKDCNTNGNDLENINIVASGLASYWSTVRVTPGAPAHGGSSVISITNNSSTKVSSFYSAIYSSYKYVETKPYFVHFIENVETVVKTIDWTVTENVAGSSTDFIESIT